MKYYFSVCVCLLTMLTMCMCEWWVRWKMFSLMWTNLKATDLYSGFMRYSEMRAMPYLIYLISYISDIYISYIYIYISYICLIYHIYIYISYI